MRIFLSVVLGVLFLCSASCRKTRTLEPGEGRVAVEGGSVWYKVIGSGTKPPVLLLHGGPGGTHRAFYHLMPLTGERPIILFDQLGSGRSDIHRDTSLLTVHHFVEQVRKLRDELQLDSYYIMGHSWGAALGLEYYLKYPEGVEGIIFSSPYLSTPVWEADADTLISQLSDSIQGLIANAEVQDEYDTPAYRYADSVYWSTYGNRNPGPRHPADTVEASMNRFIYRYMWGPSEFTATGTLKTYDNLHRLPEVRVPTLFITGEFDEARPETMLRFQEALPGSEVVVVPDAGHATLSDNTEALLEGIKGFLIQTEN